MNSIASIALSGLTAASDRLSARAENIANQQTEGYRPITPVQTASAVGPVVRSERSPTAQTRDPGTGLVMPQSDMASDIVDSIESGIAYKASAKLLKVSQDLDKSLLDVLA